MVAWYEQYRYLRMARWKARICHVQLVVSFACRTAPPPRERESEQCCSPLGVPVMNVCVRHGVKFSLITRTPPSSLKFSRPQTQLPTGSSPPSDITQRGKRHVSEDEKGRREMESLHSVIKWNSSWRALGVRLGKGVVPPLHQLLWRL